MKPKYIPDMATVLRETDPATRQRNRERAAESLERPTPPLFFQWANKSGPTAAAGGSAPSPGAEGEGEAVPYVVPGNKAPAGAPRWRSWRMVAACGALGVTALLAVLLIQVARPPQVKVKEEAAAVRVAPPEAGAGAAVPGVTAAPSALGTVEPSAPPGAPPPSAPSPPRAAPARQLKPRTATTADPHDPPAQGAPAPPPTSAPSAAPPEPLPKFFQ